MCWGLLSGSGNHVKVATQGLSSMLDNFVIAPGGKEGLLFLGKLGKLEYQMWFWKTTIGYIAFGLAPKETAYQF